VLELGHSALSHGPLPTSAGERRFSKEHFPYRISQSLKAQSNYLPGMGENDSHAKKSQERFLSLGPSEAAQHLPEGVRPDLDEPGEWVVELADGKEYAADDQCQSRDHKRMRQVALKPE
jgi:hypothetical protein